MPRPLKGEKRSEYIGRAVKFMIDSEGLTQKHALGKAYGMWSERNKVHNKKLAKHIKKGNR